MRRTNANMLQTLKWYYENERDLFERFAGWVKDMPYDNDARQRVHHWRSKTRPVRALTYDELVDYVAEDLEHDDSVVLAILKRCT